MSKKKPASERDYGRGRPVFRHEPTREPDGFRELQPGTGVYRRNYRPREDLLVRCVSSVRPVYPGSRR